MVQTPEAERSWGACRVELKGIIIATTDTHTETCGDHEQTV